MKNKESSGNLSTNYDLYYDLNKSEMIDDNYENCSKIKRKLINKIKFLIR